MKNAIVTGATGMIGITLINYLLERDIDVVAIIRENSSRKNNLPMNERLKVIECNLDGICNLQLEENDFDTFFHLAWDGTFGEERNNIDMQFANVKYTLEAVELAHRCGCTTFVGAGSQAEYGRVDGVITEKTNPMPENGYGAGKLSAREYE